MLPKIIYGKTGLEVTRIALGGFPFGGKNLARNWDPFSPDGRIAAIRTVHAAIDSGINIIDTAPSYGNGNSESIIGEAIHGRRSELILATKVAYGLQSADVRISVEESLKRLQTDFIDIIQFHGGMYTETDVRHIIEEGPLEALHILRAEGKVRYIGFTVEEPWTARPLIASGHFDTMQVRYNLIYQGAALHVLNEARNHNMGVSVMRPMTSGIFERIASYIAPEWSSAHNLYEAALAFILSDSRVHVANIGMRWPEEVQQNAEMVKSFETKFDMANLPRLTAEIYRTEDEIQIKEQSKG